LKYRCEPHKWKNANYDNFLFKIRDVPEEIDPAKIEMDDYTKQIKLVED